MNDHEQTRQKLAEEVAAQTLKVAVLAKEASEAANRLADGQRQFESIRSELRGCVGANTPNRVFITEDGVVHVNYRTSLDDRPNVTVSVYQPEPTR